MYAEDINPKVTLLILPRQCGSSTDNQLYVKLSNFTTLMRNDKCTELEQPVNK